MSRGPVHGFGCGPGRLCCELRPSLEIHVEKVKKEDKRLQWHCGEPSACLGLTVVPSCFVLQLHEYKSSSHRIFRLNNIAKALKFLEDSNVSI